jgi:nucleotide-binding universal stress UspA family protein
MFGDVPLYSDSRRDQLRGEAQSRLDEHVAGVPPPCEAVVVEGNVADEIARLAEGRGAGLVIVATHGASGVKRRVLGSVAERLIRIAPCPLLVLNAAARQAPPGEPPPALFRRILVGCDFSPDGDLAVAFGWQLAQEFQSELHLVHVIEPSGYGADIIQRALGEDLGDLIQRRARERLAERIPDGAADWCKPRTALLEGRAHQELTVYAQRNQMDLVVLGVRGMNLLESLLVGSTTDRVIRSAACPVLAVRSATVGA